MGVPSLRSSISLSLVLHAFVFFACMILINQRATQKITRTTWIEVEPLRESAKKSKDDQRIKKQIVQTERGHLVETAKPDAFLGEKNQTVDRETVSRTHTTTIGSTPKVQMAPAPDRNLTKKKAEALKELSKLGLQIVPKEPNPSVMEDRPAWANIGSTPQDFVKGIKESERTALNTKEYVFFGYFQRIRERLDRAWVPILREKLLKLYRSGRHLASDMDHATKVMVILNKQGEIVRVKIIGESGTSDLDEAAVKAFNAAGPFPNPPKGIVSPNGEIEIPWEFVLRT